MLTMMSDTGARAGDEAFPPGSEIAGMFVAHPAGSSDLLRSEIHIVTLEA